MSKEECVNKKLHPYYKTGIYGWFGEEIDDNDYVICPICDYVLGNNYYDYSAENNGDNKCPNCNQELDYSEIYEFEDTCYYEQLVELKDSKISDLEAKLAEKDKLLREKIGSLKTTDFIRMCLDCGFMIDAKDKDNQDKISFAVEQLEKVLKHFVYCGNEIVSDYCLDCEVDELKAEIADQIEAIKEMK